jgi:hypothetical protein
MRGSRRVHETHRAGRSVSDDKEQLIVQGYSTSLAWRGLLAFVGTCTAACLFAVGANAGTGNVVTNGSFETGDLTGWTANTVTDDCDPGSVTADWTVLSSPSSGWCYSGFDPDWPTDISAVDGGNFVDVTWDGEGSAGEFFSLSQMLTVPATGSDTLAWSDNSSWDLMFGATEDRTEFVDVLASDGTTVLQSFPIQTLTADTEGATGWVSHTLDLSAYAGETIGIRFRLTVPQFFTGPANFALDDVTLSGDVESTSPEAMVCLTSPAARADGTVGLFFDIGADTLAAGINVPASVFYHAVPAIYVKGYGTMCQLSDLVTYGGDPARFADAGYKVNESGDPTPPGVSPADWGALYEYYAPTG